MSKKLDTRSFVVPFPCETIVENGREHSVLMLPIVRTEPADVKRIETALTNCYPDLVPADIEEIIELAEKRHFGRFLSEYMRPHVNGMAADQVDAMADELNRRFA